jgi:hypothetical protein
MNWQLELSFHLPHDRFALGWEYIGPSDKEEDDITTFTIYFFMMTFNLHIYK